MITYQEMLRKLSTFWEKQGCIIHQSYDLEKGAGTSNPATFLRSLGPEPYRAAFVEACRRPSDGRYGTNPNRLQHYFQYQVILKPSPENIQDLYLQSLESIGFNLVDHDIRFVHDDWENPTIGAWGLGWEVWMDGMEITQFTYFQSVGGVDLKPITGEITYGTERLAMYLQKVNNVFDLQWNEHLTYGDIYHQNEVEWSHHNFEKASTNMWFRHFADYEKEANQLIAAGFPIPAYDYVVKASHAFNILDARGAISVTERTGYIGRIRDLAKQAAQAYIKGREAIGYPLMNRFGDEQKPEHAAPKFDSELLKADPDKQEDYLLEIGSEELPATFVPIGCANLEKAMRALFQKENIPFKSLKALGTPRRLAVYVEGLAMGTRPITTEKRGPSIEQAFDAKGDPTQAGEGFFRSINSRPSTLAQIKAGEAAFVSIKNLKGIDYLFAETTTSGTTTASILSAELPALILGLEFPKKMRWGNSDITYARPLRWIVSLFGDHVVPFTVGYQAADRISWGHRQLRPYNFSLVKAQDYVPILKEHFVMVDLAERKRQIISQLDALEKKLALKIIRREQVIPQVLNLVEWPQLTPHTFDRAFLRVPQEVLISEMVEHQKYFPVADHLGHLSNTFIITADNDPSDQIRHGNQKVLSARLSDGVYLYEQGLKHPLAYFNEKLKNVTFQKDLGTVFEKVERTGKHIKVLQKALQIGTPEKASRAALLSKADLATEMVFEFPELQGTIGKYYALASGEDKEVALSIEEQWMPRGESSPLPETETGVLLSLADKFDNILGCYCANLKPTSSSDPYALRRQVLGIIKMLIEREYRLPLMQIFKECIDHFPGHLTKDKDQILSEIESFILNRIKTVFVDYGFTRDEIEAALANGFSDIYDAYCKVKALRNFRESGDSFPRLFEVYKRARGQLVNQKNLSFARDLLQEKAEKTLDQTLTHTQEQLDLALTSHDYEKAYGLIALLQAPLAKLFEEVKILSENPKIRDNRIALLQRVFNLFAKLVDFSKIQENR